jgi:hypothetical protein
MTHATLRSRYRPGQRRAKRPLLRGRHRRPVNLSLVLGSVGNVALWTVALVLAHDLGLIP